MTEKAQALLSKIRKRQVLEKFNRSTLDEVGPIGGEQGIKVLQEMNALAIEEDQSVQHASATLKVICTNPGRGVRAR